MPNLTEAIGEQLVRMTEEPEVIVQKENEADNLVKAMIALLNAYRLRLDGEDIPPGFVKDPETGRLRAKVSDTFATDN